MANVNATLGPASNTAGGTSNPQSGGQASNLGGQPQILQTSNSSSNINNQSTGTAIQLQPVTNLRTSAVVSSSEVPKTNHKVSVAGIVTVSVLVLAAVVVGIYIYVSDKKAVKNT